MEAYYILLNDISTLYYIFQYRTSILFIVDKCSLSLDAYYTKTVFYNRNSMTLLNLVSIITQYKIIKHIKNIR